MSRYRKHGMMFVAVVVAMLLVAAAFIMQQQAIREQTMIDLVVPSQYIESGTELSKGMLNVIEVDRRTYRPGMIRGVALTRAIGAVAIVPLAPNEPLLAWKIDDTHLVPTRNQYTFHLPSTYIVSLANDIRTGDYVQLFVSTLHTPSYRLFPDPIVVASIQTKPGAQPNGSQLTKDGRVVQPQLEQLNVILTEAQWLQLDNLCKSGDARLIVANHTRSYGVTYHE